MFSIDIALHLKCFTALLTEVVMHIFSMCILLTNILLVIFLEMAWLFGDWLCW